MVIDLILDRKEGKEYIPKQFYNDVMNYYGIFPEIVGPIANALDGGSEEEIKKELNNYIITNDHNTEITRYINSVKWL